MNLYRIIVEHSAPKDQHTAIQGYVLAENDEEVYKHIDENHNYSGWAEKSDLTWEEYCEQEGLDATEEDPEDYEGLYGKEFMQSIIGTHGEIDREDNDYSDAYYGVTYWGWEMVKENIGFNDTNVLIGLGIAERVSISK